MFSVQFISSEAAPVQPSIIEFKANSVIFAFINVYVSCEGLLYKMHILNQSMNLKPGIGACGCRFDSTEP